MWDPRRLTTLWAFTACFRDRFLPFYFFTYLYISYIFPYLLINLFIHLFCYLLSFQKFTSLLIHFLTFLFLIKFMSIYSFIQLLIHVLPHEYVELFFRLFIYLIILWIIYQCFCFLVHIFSYIFIIRMRKFMLRCYTTYVRYASETASLYSLWRKRFTSVVSMFRVSKVASCPGIFRLDIINYVTMETDRPHLILRSLNGYSLTVQSYKVNVSMETFWQLEVPSDKKKLDRRPELTRHLIKSATLPQHGIATLSIAS
jgi:hypothetical protein